MEGRTTAEGRPDRLAAWAGEALRRAGRARALIAFLLALLVFAPGQFALPPSDRDEARFMQASKQMLETRDFVDIRFQEEPRHKKPIGIYWLQSATASLFGGAEAPVWAFRIPSWIGAAAAVALTGWALTPLVGTPAAWLAAAFMAAIPLLHVEARIAKTDAMLLAATLAAMGALARIQLARLDLWAAGRGRIGGDATAEASARPASGDAGRGTWALLWISVGAGILLKGPIILLPVGGALLWLSVAERSVAPLRATRPLRGLALALLVAAPWFVAITLKDGIGFWAEAVGRDLLGKVGSGQEKHWGPPGYYIGLFWGTFWPAAAFAPLAALWFWPKRRAPEMRLLLGWIVPTWIVFEVAATKLPHYVLPTYPAIAAIVAAALLDAARPAAPRWAGRATTILWAIPAVGLALGCAFATVAIEGALSLWALLFAALAAPALWFAGRALARGERRAALAPALVGAAVLYAGIFGHALPGLTTAFVSPRAAAEVAAHRCGAEGPVAVTTYREPSMVFLHGTDTMLVNGAEAAEALASGRAALAWIGDGRERARFDEAAGGLGFEALATIDGFNYNRGDPVTLTLFAPAGHGARCGD